MVIVINMFVGDHIKQADNKAKVKVNRVFNQVDLGLEDLDKQIQFNLRRSN